MKIYLFIMIMLAIGIINDIHAASTNQYLSQLLDSQIQILNTVVNNPTVVTAFTSQAGQDQQTLTVMLNNITAKATLLASGKKVDFLNLVMKLVASGTVTQSEVVSTQIKMLAAITSDSPALSTIGAESVANAIAALTTNAFALQSTDKAALLTLISSAPANVQAAVPSAATSTILNAVNADKTATSIVGTANLAQLKNTLAAAPTTTAPTTATVSTSQTRTTDDQNMLLFTSSATSLGFPDQKKNNPSKKKPVKQTAKKPATSKPATKKK
jgi:hypothetical protein